MSEYRNSGNVNIGDIVKINKISYNTITFLKVPQFKLGKTKGKIVERLQANKDFFIVQLIGSEFKNIGQVESYSKIGIRNYQGYHIFQYHELEKSFINLFETEE